MNIAATRAIKAKGERTREQILNAAEELFGQSNFDAVSIRDVADKAEVALGVVGYHFKGKEALFEAVALRRAKETNQLRLEQLRGYRDPTVEQILDAFIRPILTRMQQPEWRNYARIIAHITHEQRWAHVNARLFRATAKEFFKALRRARPEVSTEALARGFIYVVFVFLGAMQENTKLRALSQKYSPDDIDKVLNTIIPFVTGGINALVDSEQDRSALPSRSRIAQGAPLPRGAKASGRAQLQHR